MALEYSAQAAGDMFSAEIAPSTFDLSSSVRRRGQSTFACKSVTLAIKALRTSGSSSAMSCANRRAWDWVGVRAITPPAGLGRRLPGRPGYRTRTRHETALGDG